MHENGIVRAPHTEKVVVPELLRDHCVRHPCPQPNNLRGLESLNDGVAEILKRRRRVPVRCRGRGGS